MNTPVSFASMRGIFNQHPHQYPRQETSPISNRNVYKTYLLAPNHPIESTLQQLSTLEPLSSLSSTSLASLLHFSPRSSLGNDFMASEAALIHAYCCGRDAVMRSLLPSRPQAPDTQLENDLYQIPVLYSPRVYDTDCIPSERTGGTSSIFMPMPIMNENPEKSHQTIPVLPRSSGKPTFPEILHRMLTDADEKGFNDIVGFFPHGRAFAIFKREQFVEEILPNYFNQKQMSSFRRQLNLYCFTRIISGSNRGGYFHEIFLRGRPELCVYMRRVAVKSASTESRVRSAAACFALRPGLRQRVEESRFNEQQNSAIGHHVSQVLVPNETEAGSYTETSVASISDLPRNIQPTDIGYHTVENEEQKEQKEQKEQCSGTRHSSVAEPHLVLSS